jgi:alcohol dehydrogenase, propanol-preferring
VGVDARDEGPALTRELGVDLVADARRKKGDVVRGVMQTTGGEGCYATINLSDVRSAAALACATTRLHSRMIQIAQVRGLGRQHALLKAADTVQPNEASVPFSELVFRNVRIEGSLMCSVQQSQDMLDMVAKHNITVKTNLFYGLDSTAELVELAHSGHMPGKGVVIVAEEAVKLQAQRCAKLV